MFERRTLHGQFLFDGPVVDGPQATHIIGCGIGAHSGRFQKVLIAHHQVGIYLIERYIVFATETPETVDDSRVPFGCTGLPDLSHLPNNIPSKRDEPLTVRRHEVTLHHFFGGIIFAGTVKTCDNVPEPFGVLVQNLF